MKINNFFKKIIFSLSVFFIPLISFAQSNSDLGPILNNKQGVEYYTFNMLMTTLVKAVNFALAFAVLVSVGFITYAGWLYMTSGGNASKRTQANEIFKKIIIGFFIAASAWLIVQAIVKSLDVEKTYVPGSFLQK